MLNYDKQSRIFSCILLTRHMIFLVQFGRNKHLLIFQRAQIARALRACAILLVFIKKIYSCLLIPNCTRNHVITYTNSNIDFCYCPGWRWTTSRATHFRYDYFRLRLSLVSTCLRPYTNRHELKINLQFFFTYDGRRIENLKENGCGQQMA